MCQNLIRMAATGYYDFLKTRPGETETEADARVAAEFKRRLFHPEYATELADQFNLKEALGHDHT